MGTKDFPLFARRSLELLGLFLMGAFVILGQDILMPLLMAFFLSIMLLPVYRFCRKRKIPEALSILLPLLILLLFMAGILWLFSKQVSFLLDDFTEIEKNVTKHLDYLSSWISHAFGFSAKEQVTFLNEQSSKLFNLMGDILRGAAGSLSGLLLFFGLLPIYIYLMILYKAQFMRFILLWFKPDEHAGIREIISQIERMIKKYLAGLLIQISYIIFLLGGILMLFGIKHALLIGIIFAFLNLIPYLGAFVGNILGVLITLTSSERLSDILIVLGTITFVQFLDNNILMPRIVGAQVKINALASIVGIIIAGAMTGISGMFLAMPIIAILKIVFDHTEEFKKWGILLGDESSESA
jgi:predicted PurR-regulated permease PerM